MIRNGPTIYHTGDTAYFKDMEIIGETYSIDVVPRGKRRGEFLIQMVQQLTKFQGVLSHLTIIEEHVTALGLNE